MSTHRAPLLLVPSLALCALAAAALAGSAAAPRSAAPPAPAVDKFETMEELLKAVEQADRLGDKDRVKALYEDNETLATTLVLMTGDTMAERPGEVLAKRYSLLSKCWTLAFNSKFPRKYESFLSRLKASQIKNRQDYLREYRAAVAKFAEVTATKDSATILGLAQKFQALGEGFESIGDKYHASSSFFNEADLRGEGFHGPDTDLHKVADAVKKGLDMREEWELEDSFYRRWKPFYEGLRGRGYGEEAKEAGEAPGAAPKAKESVPAIAVALA
ncbi:MAG: hypothetical protein AAFP86_23420, partial [Planctomycetota bacterium]